MKDSFFSGKIRKDCQYTVHLFFQILILSKLHSHVPVDKADRITAVKLDMIRDLIIFLENSRKGNCRIQHRFPFDIQFLIHNYFIYLDSVKVRNRFIPCL